MQRLAGYARVTLPFLSTRMRSSPAAALTASLGSIDTEGEGEPIAVGLSDGLPLRVTVGEFDADGDEAGDAVLGDSEGEFADCCDRGFAVDVG